MKPRSCRHCGCPVTRVFRVRGIPEVFPACGNHGRAVLVFLMSEYKGRAVTSQGRTV